MLVQAPLLDRSPLGCKL